MSSQTYAVYTVSPRHWLSELRLAILIYSGTVPADLHCEVHFSLLVDGAVAHPFAAAAALGAHVRPAAATPFKGPLAKLVKLYIRGRQTASPVRRAWNCFSLSAVCVQVEI